MRHQIAKALHATFPGDYHHGAAAVCRPCQERTAAVWVLIEPIEAERDRLKAAIEKAVNEDYECGGACEYGRGCPYMPELETALDPPAEPTTGDTT